jgi:aerobic carbon-monoxide dehydrogenase small subunit
MESSVVSLIVNGVRRDLVVPPNALLAEVLADDLGLRGVHHSCGGGDCGTCTVLVDGEPRLACLTLAVSVRGSDITTVEGVAQGVDLHPLQEAFVQGGAVQCGYCTPGMILASLAMLARNPRPTRQEVVDGLAGNLCRCTGYSKIVDAVLATANAGV